MGTRKRIRLLGIAAACGLVVSGAGSATAGPVDDAVLVKDIPNSIPTRSNLTVAGDTLFFTVRACALQERWHRGGHAAR